MLALSVSVSLLGSLSFAVAVPGLLVGNGLPCRVQSRKFRPLRSERLKSARQFAKEPSRPVLALPSLPKKSRCGTGWRRVHLSAWLHRTGSIYPIRSAGGWRPLTVRPDGMWLIWCWMEEEGIRRSVPPSAQRRSSESVIRKVGDFMLGGNQPH